MKSFAKHPDHTTVRQSDKPLVSVIMPTYNSARYLHESICSILSQDYDNIEFIIIDDCSADDSWEIIQKYAQTDSRIKPLRNDQNHGIPITRNRGFGIASEEARYYAIFDADDIADPRRISIQVRYLEENRECALVGSAVIIIDENSEEKGRRHYPTGYTNLKKIMARYNPLAQSSVMVRSSVLLNDVGFYNEDYDRCEDYELWFRIATKYRIDNIERPLLKYRISSTQTKATSLKATLRTTIDIQKKWLFNRNYISVLNIGNWYAEKILLLLPDKVVFWLFRKIFY